MELQRHSSQQPVIEVLRGELRIGKELNMLQELLKEWYYTGFFVGTLSFATFYLILWMSLVQLLQRLGLFRLLYGLEEPMCDLDMDLSLGGFGGEDIRDRNVGAGEENDSHNDDDHDDELSEPRFEDWNDSFEPPTTQDRSVPMPAEPSRASQFRRSVSREDSEEEWEDIFYPAVDGIRGGVR